MKIGNIKIRGKAFLAPLAGITSLPFRLLVKKLGCPLLYSEMISANALCYKSPKTFDMLKTTKEDSYLAFQIFGSKADIMAEAAQIIEAHGADILDINFGCSVKKVLKTNSGAALMKDYKLSGEIISEVKKKIKIPLSIKIRSGWEPSGIDAINIAKIAQDAGADAIIIHPRLATQKFLGKADWSLIKKVKETVQIPVIGNGDILLAEDALRMLNETNCDGTMIGRGAIKDPYIFSKINALIKNQVPKTISTKEHFETISSYLDDICKFFGEKAACMKARGQIAMMTKGFSDSKRLREKLFKASTKDEFEKILKDFFENIA